MKYNQFVTRKCPVSDTFLEKKFKITLFKIGGQNLVHSIFVFVDVRVSSYLCFLNNEPLWYHQKVPP